MSTEVPADTVDGKPVSDASVSLHPNDSEMAEALPSDLMEAICMIEVQARSELSTQRPTGLVDARVMSKRVDDCLEVLRVATVSSGIIEHVSKLKTGLEKYSNAVGVVAEHLKLISDKARDDVDAVCEHHLLTNFGVPPTHGMLLRGSFLNHCLYILVPVRDHLIPSIPIWFIKKRCDLGRDSLGILPSDRQAQLVSNLSVMLNSDHKIRHGRWLDNFNGGELFGDRNFIDLASYRQM